MSDLTGGSGDSESHPSLLDTLKLSPKAEMFNILLIEVEYL